MKLQSQPLNGEQMLQLVDNKANLIIVNDLIKYNHIDAVLGEYGAVILLYENEKYKGHWVCLFKINDSTLMFFDPYGLKPDEQLQFSDYSKPYLSMLLKDSGYRVKYNNKDLQKFCKQVSTCGKFVSLRLIFRDLPNRKFISLFLDNKHYTPDFWVSALTAFL
jgi:hypothetical protein